MPGILDNVILIIFQAVGFISEINTLRMNGKANGEQQNEIEKTPTGKHRL